MARLVKIKCLEEQIFEVELSAARLSPKLMELLNSKTTSDETPIVLEDGYMTSDVLGRILAWCTRHKDDSEDKLAVSDSDEDEYEDWTMHRNRLALLLQKRYKPLPSVSKWDRQFMTAESNINLYGIILGALFLKIKKLKSIATSVSGHFPNFVVMKIDQECIFLFSPGYVVSFKQHEAFRTTR